MPQNMFKHDALKPFRCFACTLVRVCLHLPSGGRTDLTHPQYNQNLAKQMWFVAMTTGSEFQTPRDAVGLAYLRSGPLWRSNNTRQGRDGLIPLPAFLCGWLLTVRDNAMKDNLNFLLDDGNTTCVCCYHSNRPHAPAAV